MKEAVVIGGGPAGLMAAEMLIDQGISVTIADAKPTLGRKLLMAGKSGLNLTKDEPFEKFLLSFGPTREPLEPMLSAFSNFDVQHWAIALGQEVFTGSSDRVFPKSMKASPLLRAWLARLSAKGVRFRTNWRWQGWHEGKLTFETPEGRKLISSDATVLALGGASWPRLGSDGFWASILAEKDTPLAPFQPANVGLNVQWTDHMHKHFGTPVKAATLKTEAFTSQGEFIVTAKGLEGGGIYEISRQVRDGEPLFLDMLPSLKVETVAAKLNSQPKKVSLTNKLRRGLKLDQVRIALLFEFLRPVSDNLNGLAAALKNLPVNHAGPRPIDEAISTAGGVQMAALNNDLMLNDIPGVFCAGEMLDWEAPTGGYLITGCLATGRWAGLGAAKFLKNGEL